MNKELFDLDNPRMVLMGLLAKNGVTADEYSKFLEKFKDCDFEKVFSGEDEDDDEEIDYLPMDDDNEKTLRLKIQLRDVNKPPMWREVLVPADFNFSQLHYVIQAVTGLKNNHLWQFERKPYDRLGLAIGIPKRSFDSFGIEDCSHIADNFPLTAFLSQKGDKLVYVYDFKNDWIFNVSVLEVMERQGEVAECIKYKSDLQAIEDMPGFIYPNLRNCLNDPKSVPDDWAQRIAGILWLDDKNKLQQFLERHTIDLEEVNDELSDIPEKWEDID